MASEEQVKHYLAYWFQLGKRVLVPNRQTSICPANIFQGNRYSPEFETCWQYILSYQTHCYLEGTEQTIAQLLSPVWEIKACARCEMPIPVLTSGIQPLTCPCVDLPSWPNSELPLPRSAINNTAHLNRIQQRLQQRETD